MAPEVVDLISSSPSPKRSAAQSTRSRNNGFPVPSVVGGSRASHPSAALIVTEDTIFTSSYSTFPSSDPGLASVARQLPLEAEPTPKRRRLSPVIDSPDHRSLPPSVESPAVPFPSISSERRLRAIGMVEVGNGPCSDPFLSSPHRNTTSILGRAAPALIDLSSPVPELVVAEGVDVPPVIDTEVIASSSEAVQTLRSNGNNLSKQSSPNPFESSPPRAPRQPELSKPIATVPPVDSSDPFASSPPPRKVNQSVVSPLLARQQERRKLRDYDPISSSAPEASLRDSPTAYSNARASGSTKSIITIDDSNSETGHGSDDELPDINNIKAAVPGRTARQPLQRALSDTYATNRRIPSQQLVTSKASAEEKARIREAKQRARAAEKEAKQQEREQQKRVRALEKEKAAALAEVNKIRTDKKVSTREMVVDLPAGLKEGLKTQIETILEGLDVQHTTWQSPVPDVVKMRRKVDSRFDDDLGHWVPCPQRIVDEDHIIIIITAVELVKLAQEGLDAYVESLTAQFPTKRQLYVLEGVSYWMRKNRSARNRQFAAGVRAQTDGNTTATSSQPRQRAAAPPQEPISEDIIEDAMLQLQVVHGALIHHTNVPLETAQWIGHFTQHLSTAPYRRQRERSTTTAGFCMDSGQVRTGDDTADTYVRMLQEIARVTQPVAYGVAAEFGTVTKLVNGLEEGGPGRLEAVRKCANKDGAFSDRTLGKAVSKRLWQVFLGQDETSTDV